jgi:voltage-gated potassium channel
MRFRLPTRSAEALAEHERRSSLAMFIVSLLYLSLVFVELLPGEKPSWDITIVDAVFWIVIALDYVWRVLLLAPDPGRYARRLRCVLDLVVVGIGAVLFGMVFIPGIPYVPVVVEGLALARVGAQAGRTVLQARRVYSRRSLSWVIPLGMLLTVFLSVWIWRFEAMHAGTNIHNWNDALWYSMATLMTVGYGDLVPVTPQGRIAGVLLMVVGIALFSWITASMASIFVQREDIPVDQALHAKLDELADRLARIEERLPAERGESGREAGAAGLEPSSEDS